MQWWKCCPDHVLNEQDVLCESCVKILHPEGVTEIDEDEVD